MDSLFDDDDFRLCNTDDINPVGLLTGQKIQWDADREDRIAMYERRIQRGETLFQMGDARNPTPHSPNLFRFLNSPAYDDFCEEFDKVDGFAREIRKQANRRVKGRRNKEPQVAEAFGPDDARLQPGNRVERLP